MTSAEEIAGVAFTDSEGIADVTVTGSVKTARLIGKSLAAKSGPLAPLIAETGGQNVMIVDASALLEQEEIAAAFIAKLDGALQEIEAGDLLLLATDVGPLIDADALAQRAHGARSDVARRYADGKRYRVRILFFAASFRN